MVDVLIKKKRLEWVGHLARMDHKRVVEKIFEGKIWLEMVGRC
jgi:hypothetical protein